jgi:hypothetical protein
VAVVTRYTVAVSVDVVERPARPVAESARNLATLATLLPPNAQLRELHLPQTTGLAEVRVDLDANRPADALHMLNLALELVAAAAAGDLDSLGLLHHASVVEYDGAR